MGRPGPPTDGPATSEPGETPAMDPRTYDWFAYFFGLRDHRHLKPHHMRDGPAFVEISALFQRRGYQYGQIVPNGPPEHEEFNEKVREVERISAGGPCNIEDIESLWHPDPGVVSFEPGNVIIVPTRPPLNDLVHGDKVRSQPGFTWLERQIFCLCRDYFPVCSRSHVRLSPAVAAHLGEAYGNRADIIYKGTGEPWYQKLTRLDGSPGKNRVPRRPRRTAAYVLFLSEVESLGGADLVLAFGMGGTQTLLICHRLRNDLAWVLDRPGLKMIEMTADDAETSGGLEHAHRWKMELVLDMSPLR